VLTQGLFLLDLDRCTGCAACVIACTNENPVSEDLSWRQIHTFNEARFPAQPVFHYSLACNHCYDPACMINCPADAYTKDPRTGAVLVDGELCIGCRYCSWVCPYEAPQYDPGAGVMEKCTFCPDRQAEGLPPACVTACPMDALRFEPDGEPGPVDRPGFPETGLLPAMKITGGRRHTAPRMTAASAPPGPTEPGPAIHWQDLIPEWSLWIFTTVATLMVAWWTATTASGSAIELPALAGFGAAGFVAMIVSALHLGKITRIYRAVLNFRRSWISREVVFFSAFFAVACGIALRAGPHPVVLWTISIIGFAALYSMDMVYRVPGQTVPAVPHSAMTMLSAAYYVGLLLASPALALPAAGVKLVLYLRRQRLVPAGAALGFLRVALGLAAPCVLLLAGGIPSTHLVAAAVLGELVDRAEFYAGLGFLTPSRQIQRELSRAA